MIPTRIQRKRTKGWKMPENTVVVDRTTKWGNPFKPTDICLGNDKDFKRGEPIGDKGAVQAFRNLCENTKKREPILFAEKIAPLRGKNLACWCKIGEPCHADILLELANK